MNETNVDQLRREAEFHDNWAADMDPATTLVDETFTAITALENAHIARVFGDVRGKRVLDYGCGSAEGGVYFAKQGASVVGVDVSTGMLQAAQGLAKHHHVEIETRVVDSAKIPASDGEFDLIYGNGVLHHVNLHDAMPELARCLKPTGRACFIEPLSYNPVINVYRRMAASVRTADEQALTFEDIERFRGHFAEVSHQEFWLTSLAIFGKFFLIDRAHPSKVRYWKKVVSDAQRNARWFKNLPLLDRKILDRVPFLGRLCWTTVIQVAKPIAR